MRSPYQEDFFEIITNVNFGDDLWVAFYCHLITGNNSVPAQGTSTYNFGGLAFDMLTLQDNTSFRITPAVLAQDFFGVTHHFIQNLGDDFSDNIQAWVLIKAIKAPSFFGPEVPLIGQGVQAQGVPLTSGGMNAGLTRSSRLKGGTIALRVDTIGMPVGMHLDFSAGVAGEGWSQVDGGATMDFQVDVGEETLLQT